MPTETILLQAPSKVGKTTELYFLAKHILSLYPKGKAKIRLVTADKGGSDPFYDSGLIESGQVDILEVHNNGQVVDIMDKITKGYWPDSQGNLTMNEACQTIAKENVVAYFFEGITEFSELLKHHMAQNPEITKNEVKIGGFKASAVWQEGDSITASLGQAQIGLGQQKIVGWVINSQSLPLDWLVWSTHEDSRFNQAKGKEIITPSVSFGTAENTKLSQKFRSHFRMTIQSIAETQGEETIVREIRALYFKLHEDPITGATALCGVRLLPSWMKVLEKKYPNGYIECNPEIGGLTIFFKAKAKLAEKFKAMQTQET